MTQSLVDDVNFLYDTAIQIVGALHSDDRESYLKDCRNAAENMLAVSPKSEKSARI